MARKLTAAQQAAQIAILNDVLREGGAARWSELQARGHHYMQVIACVRRGNLKGVWVGGRQFYSITTIGRDALRAHQQAQDRDRGFLSGRRGCPGVPRSFCCSPLRTAERDKSTGERMMTTFTDEHIAKCKSAMTKPAPMEALRLLASGRVVVEVRPDGDCYLDTLDGRRVRDPDHPDALMPISGAWPLLAAGMIDWFGVLTDAGRAVLAGEPSHD